MTQTKAQLIDGKTASIEFNTGSAAAPTVSFTGDSNTGLYSPGADQVALSTGGTGRLFIDSAGLVGIGTSSPVNTLDVVGGMRSQAVSGGLAIFSLKSDRATSTANNQGVIQWYDQSNNILAAIQCATVAGNNQGNLHIFTANTTNTGEPSLSSFTFSKEGRLGIGTSDPEIVGHTSYKNLVISSATNTGITINCSTGAAGGIIFNDTNGGLQGSVAYEHSSDSLQFASNGASRAWITSTGDFDCSANGNNFGVIHGGFGARSTSGTLDWNHISNARSGNGQTLLVGTATNGPGGSGYYHSFCFEYSTKSGSGNMTQLAIGYNVNTRYMRYRFSNVWTSWVAF